MSLTASLAISLSGKNITVNAVSPGWIHTGEDYQEVNEASKHEIPINRVGKPQDAVNLCLFLSKAESDFINGENIVLDGGSVKKMIWE